MRLNLDLSSPWCLRAGAKWLMRFVVNLRIVFALVQRSGGTGSGSFVSFWPFPLPKAAMLQRFVPSCRRSP